ncbi:MAG: hypothetical protein IJO11_08165, partial [Alphaproteobacteria bacterium]|nr:hypothetical protein [Alphaproteobacteria bacterium]
QNAECVACSSVDENKPYWDGVECVATCPTEKAYVADNVCVESCLMDKPYVDNASCVSECPSDKPVPDVNKICQTCAEIDSSMPVWDAENKMCVACANGTYWNGTSCGTLKEYCTVKMSGYDSANYVVSDDGVITYTGGDMTVASDLDISNCDLIVSGSLDIEDGRLKAKNVTADGISVRSSSLLKVSENVKATTSGFGIGSGSTMEVEGDVIGINSEAVSYSYGISLGCDVQVNVVGKIEGHGNTSGVYFDCLYNTRSINISAMEIIGIGTQYGVYGAMDVDGFTLTANSITGKGETYGIDFSNDGNASGVTFNIPNIYYCKNYSIIDVIMNGTFKCASGCACDCSADSTICTGETPQCDATNHVCTACSDETPVWDGTNGVCSTCEIVYPDIPVWNGTECITQEALCTQIMIDNGFSSDSFTVEGSTITYNKDLTTDEATNIDFGNSNCNLTVAGTLNLNYGAIQNVTGTISAISTTGVGIENTNFESVAGTISGTGLTMGMNNITVSSSNVDVIAKATTTENTGIGMKNCVFTSGEYSIDAFGSLTGIVDTSLYEATISDKGISGVNDGTNESISGLTMNNVISTNANSYVYYCKSYENVQLDGMLIDTGATAFKCASGCSCDCTLNLSLCTDDTPMCDSESRNCVSSCTSDKFISEDGLMCIASCPKYRDGQQCVTSCPQYIENNVCTDACSSSNPYLAGTECVASCPTDKPYLNGTQCKTASEMATICTNAMKSAGLTSGYSVLGNVVTYSGDMTLISNLSMPNCDLKVNGTLTINEGISATTKNVTVTASGTYGLNLLGSMTVNGNLTCTGDQYGCYAVGTSTTPGTLKVTGNVEGTTTTTGAVATRGFFAGSNMTTVNIGGSLTGVSSAASGATNGIFISSPSVVVGAAMTGISHGNTSSTGKTTAGIQISGGVVDAKSTVTGIVTASTASVSYGIYTRLGGRLTAIGNIEAQNKATEQTQDGTYIAAIRIKEAGDSLITTNGNINAIGAISVSGTLKAETSSITSTVSRGVGIDSSGTVSAGTSITVTNNSTIAAAPVYITGGVLSAGTDITIVNTAQNYQGFFCQNATVNAGNTISTTLSCAEWSTRAIEVSSGCKMSAQIIKGKIPSSNTDGYGLYILSGGSITASSAIYYCPRYSNNGTVNKTPMQNCN